MPSCPDAEAGRTAMVEISQTAAKCADQYRWAYRSAMQYVAQKWLNLVRSGMPQCGRLGHSFHLGPLEHFLQLSWRSARSPPDVGVLQSSARLLLKEMSQKGRAKIRDR